MKHLTQEEVNEQKKLYDEYLNSLKVGAEKTAFGIWLASVKFNKNKQNDKLNEILENHNKTISENL